MIKKILFTIRCNLYGDTRFSSYDNKGKRVTCTTYTIHVNQQNNNNIRRRI